MKAEQDLVNGRSCRCLPVNLRQPVSVRVSVLLTTCVVLLAIGHGIVSVSGRLIAEGVLPQSLYLLTMTGEMTIPAWFSTCLLWTAAMGLAAIAWRHWSLRLAGAVGWTFLAAVFMYLSIDENVALHEVHFKTIGRSIFTQAQEHTRTWLTAGLSLAALVAAMSVPLLRRIPVPTACTMVLAGAVFLTGAAGFEWIGGVLENQGAALRWYNLMVCLEESFEMLGVVIFLHAVTSYLAALLTATGVLAVGPADARRYADADAAALARRRVA